MIIEPRVGTKPLDLNQYVEWAIQHLWDTADLADNPFVREAIGEFARFAMGITQAFEREAEKWKHIELEAEKWKHIELEPFELAGKCFEAFQKLEGVYKALGLVRYHRRDRGLRSMELHVPPFGQLPRDMVWHAFETMAAIFRQIHLIPASAELVSDEVLPIVGERIGLLERDRPGIFKPQSNPQSKLLGDEPERIRRLQALNILRVGFAPSQDRLKIVQDASVIA